MANPGAEPINCSVRDLYHINPDLSRKKYAKMRITRGRRHSRRRSADRLYIVAIGIEHKRTVIIRMVLRPETRRSVIHSAGRQAGGVEGIDRRAVGRREGDMRIGHHLVALADPKERLS